MHFSIKRVLEIANFHFLESYKCHQANLIELKFQQQLEVPSFFLMASSSFIKTYLWLRCSHR